VPIARLKDWANGSVVLSGPLSPRAGLVVGGTASRGAQFSKEGIAGTHAGLASGFAHLVFTPSRQREVRALGWLQRSDTPFENWRAFGRPDATTGNTAVHVQATIEDKGPGPWRVFAGMTQRARSNDVGATSATVYRITDGPIAQFADTVADVTARRVSAGARYEPRAGSGHLHLGVDLDRASTVSSGRFAGTLREFEDTTAARIWTYSSANADSNRSVGTLAGFANYATDLSPALSLDAGLRAESVRGRAEGATTSVNWTSLLPHAYLRLALGDTRALRLGYARSANALRQTWLAFGDPNASIATVSSAAAPAVVVSRVGPGTGGNTAFSALDPDLKRPYTDEFVIGFEKRRSASTRYTLTGIARRESNLLGVVNPGVGASSYATVSVPDAGKDLIDPADDRLLTVYNRLPASFGKDTWLVTNPDVQAPTAYALRMAFEHSSRRVFLLFAATASAANGPVSNRGYGPLENDQDLPGETYSNPNAASYARGRLFSDRAFTIKWTTVYRMPHDFTIGAIARYQDGQPFSRMVLASNLAQGAEAIQAYPNAGSRYTFTGTLDLRVQKGIGIGRGRVDAILDAYNLFTRSNEVEEYVMGGAAFRTPTAIEPPHSVHLGLRITF
jgi:hypothetical protein